MSRIKIACTSDWHVSNRTYEVCSKALSEVLEVVDVERPDYTMLLGDLTHVRGQIEGRTALLIKDTVRDMLDFGTYVAAIPGNHDLYRNGEGSNLDAIFAHTDPTNELRPDEPEVWYQNGPGIIQAGDHGEIGFFMLPFYHKWQYEADGTDEELVADLRNYIKGALATLEQRGCTTKLCFTHMSILGAQLDNEQVMKVGHDLALNADVFDGFDLVVSGHLHRPQSLRMGTGEIVYIGALQPFTFGDRWEQPRVVLIDAGPNGDVSWSAQRLTVQEPLLRWTFDSDIYNAEYSELSIPLALERFIADMAPQQGVPGARLRIEAVLPGSHLKLIDKELQQRLRERFSLKELKILPRRTDSVIENDVDIEQLSFTQLLVRWLDEQTDIGGADRQRILANAARIEDDHADAFHDVNYEHVPLHTQMWNWKQWEHVSLDVASWPETVCIHGDNAAGKSNLAEAEAFALYGVNLKGTPLVNCIKDGEKEARVRHAFESNGHKYVVDRTIRRQKQTIKTTLRFLRIYDDNHVKELSVATNRQTQERIDDLVGPFAHYRMRFAQQQDIAALIEATDEQRLDIFQRLLRFDLSTRAEIAKVQQKGYEEDATTNMARARSLLEQTDEAVHALPQEVRLHISETTTPLEAVQLELQATDDELRLATEAREQREARERALGNRIVALEAEIGGLQDSLASSDEVSVDRAQEAVNHAKGEYLAAVNGREAWERVEPARIELPDEADVARLRESREALLLDLADDTSVLDREVAKLQNIQLDSARKTERLRGLRERLDSRVDRSTLPCHAATWFVDDEDGNEVELSNADCPFLNDDTDEIESQIATLESELSELTEQEERIEDGIEDLQSDIADGNERLTATNEQIRAHEKLLAEHREHQSWADRLETMREVERIRGDALVVAEDNLKRARQAAERDTIRRVQIRQRIKEAEDSIKTVRINQADAARLAQQARRNETELRDAVTRLRTLRDEMERVMEQIKKADEAKALANEAQRTVVALRQYRNACGRTGIPLVFLKSVLPEYERVVNEMLEPVDMRYELSTTKTTSAGDERPALDQTFHDANGSHPVKEASGFQRVVLGIALRLALTKIHSDLTGSSATTVWQDEGWGAFSAQNIPLASALIDRIRDSLDARYVYITHVPELQETARLKVEVKRTNDGSEIWSMVG